MKKLLRQREKKITFTGMIIALILITAGMCVGGLLPAEVRPKLFAVSFAAFAAAALLLIMNIIQTRGLYNELAEMTVEEIENKRFDNRKQAEKVRREQTEKLLRISAGSSRKAVFLGICGVIVAFLGGASWRTDSYVIIILISAFLIISGIGRRKMKAADSVFGSEASYVSEDEFPELYSIAERARNALGMEGNIKIAFGDEYNVGSALFGNTISIVIGAIALGVCTEEEMYCVMLHELQHIKEDQKPDNRKILETLEFCYEWKQYKTVMRVSDFFYTYKDLIWKMEYDLYKDAVSVILETEADEAMKKYGSPDAAASNLVRMKYYDMYRWTETARDREPLYSSGKINRSFVFDEIADFRRVTEENRFKWNLLIKREIPSDSDTHPIVRKRLEALGSAVIDADFPELTGSYGEECRRAIIRFQNEVCDSNESGYEEDRELEYLYPLRDVEQWELRGKPLAAEEYRDIVSALGSLGRYSEAMELCSRAIAELSPTAAAHAYFMKGMHLLRNFDDAGIDYLNTAMDLNNNYAEEGLEAIGQYSCLTGNQKELDRYRQRFAPVMQKQIDVYDELLYLRKGDRIIPEELPDGMLEDILSYIGRLDKGAIDKVYLVRKIVNDELSASAFVVKFRKDADRTVCGEIMHKIFNYLDTFSDHQFALFEYEQVRATGFRPESVQGSQVYEG